MTNYFATFQSARHPISWEYDYDPDSDPSPPIPGETLLADVAAKLTGSEVVVKSIDSETVGWFAWCEVMGRTLRVIVGALPDGKAWWISCASYQGLVRRLLRGSNDGALRHLAETVDTILHGEPTFTEIRWYELYPEGPYADHPQTPLR